MFVATGNDRFPGAQVARCNVTHRGVELAKPLLDYLQSNFFVSTAGFFDDAALRFTLDKLGAERVMFSTDYPFEDTVAASRWFDRAPLSDQERQSLGHGATPLPCSGSTRGFDYRPVVTIQQQ
jgi:hypothetical protein